MSNERTSVSGALLPPLECHSVIHYRYSLPLQIIHLACIGTPGWRGAPLEFDVLTPFPPP